MRLRRFGVCLIADHTKLKTEDNAYFVYCNSMAHALLPKEKKIPYKSVFICVHLPALLNLFSRLTGVSPKNKNEIGSEFNISDQSGRQVHELFTGV